MTKSDLVTIYLSLLLAITQWFWIKAEKRAAYLDGRASVYAEWATDGTEGTCYATDGCGKTKRKAGSK